MTRGPRVCKVTRPTSLRPTASISPGGKRRLKRHWVTLQWRGRRLSLAEETFTNLCRSCAQNLVVRRAGKESD